jgi:tetratricopeptide (TPR) repeat protein
VHETLTPDRVTDNYVTLSYKLEHWADDSKSRGQYLPLLELAAAERPDDPRTAHYLGREYSYRSEWAKAEVELKRHIEMPQSQWGAERSASMRHLSKSMLGMGRWEEAIEWSKRATEEAPDLRETWVDYAQICHNHMLWDECYRATEQALSMLERPAVYLSEPYAWGSAAADLGSVAAWHLGMKGRSIELAELAHSISPDDGRIKTNLAFFKANKEEDDSADSS